MAEKMMEYLRSQPQVWAEIFQKRSEILADFAKRGLKKECKNIIMIGSSSSYNAACCVQRLYADLRGIQVYPCAPTRASSMLGLLSPEDTMVFLISQSGESTSTIHVMEQVRQKGFLMVALTQLLSSSIAKGGDIIVEVACGEESVGPKTKGFTATVLTLQLVALAMSDNAEAVKEIEQALLGAFSKAGDVIEQSVSWAKENSRLLRCAPHVLMLGDENNREAVREGCLKVLECLYIPCMDYEFEEYLHGVQCSIAQGSHVILVVSDNHNRERMLRLAEFNEKHGGVSYIISLQKETGVPGELFIPADNSPYTACYHALLPFQVISALVSADKGINCDLSKFPTFVHELNTKNW